MNLLESTSFIYSSLHLIILINVNSRPNHKKNIALANLFRAEWIKSKKTETVKNKIAFTDHHIKTYESSYILKTAHRIVARRFMIKTGSWIGCIHQDFLSLIVRVDVYIFGPNQSVINIINIRQCYVTLPSKWI